MVLFSSRIPALGTRLIMWLMGLTYEVRGQEHINREKGGVIVINHQSGIDLAGKTNFIKILSSSEIFHTFDFQSLLPFGH